MLRGPQCFQQAGVTRYPILPGWLNQLCCMLNVYFMTAYSNPDTRLVTADFGAFIICGTFISTYEAFRPRSGWGSRLAAPFMALGQLATWAAAIPAYLAIDNSARPPAGTPNRPRPEGAWTALLATTLGLALPSVYLEVTHWSYLALALWQPFPLYIVALSVLLPQLLRTFGPYTPTVPIALVTLLGAAASIYARTALITGTDSSLAELFLVTNRPASSDLAYAARLLFTLDYAFSVLAIASRVILDSPLGVAVALVTVLLSAVTVGPGAGVIMLWAYQELTAGSVVAHKTSRSYVVT